MIVDRQVKKLFKYRRKGMNISISSDKSGMSRKSGGKYLKSGKLPSQIKKQHDWKTRENPFSDDWEYIKGFLENNDGIESKSLFLHLQMKSSGKYQDGQLRSLQRKIKYWKATEGPGKEVIFDQIHNPGELCQSDFTDMNKIGITINGTLFRHKMYHFVLTYSNWETGTICFSESMESLSYGFQKALWKLGGVPKKHRTDRLSSAVKNLHNKKEFTKRYQELLDHYHIQGEKTQPSSPNENGDVEQSHYRYKKAIEQALIIRGSYDFNSREDYEEYIMKIFDQLNAGRREKLKQELSKLRELPKRRLEDAREYTIRVSRNSTIRVNHNAYSVHSRMIGSLVKVKMYAEYLEVFLGQKKVEQIPRLYGEEKYNIQYRHIIDSLVRKPGAFENYKYKESLFPTTWFRIAYDILKDQNPYNASKIYLKILHLAAIENEDIVNQALITMINLEKEITIDRVVAHLSESMMIMSPMELNIPDVDLSVFDKLYNEEVFVQ